MNIRAKHCQNKVECAAVNIFLQLKIAGNHGVLGVFVHPIVGVEYSIDTECAPILPLVSPAIIVWAHL